MERRAARVGVALLVLLASLEAAPPRAVGVSRRPDGLHVRAEALGLIEGRTLEELQDGRAVRLVIEAATAPAEAGPWATQAQGRFILSYDLWEERFAATFAGPPPRSISHLSAADAEAWCVDQLRILPSEATRPGGRFWLKVTYRVEDEVQGPRRGEAGNALRGLIELFSRRDAAHGRTGVVVSGPLSAE